MVHRLVVAEGLAGPGIELLTLPIATSTDHGTRLAASEGPTVWLSREAGQGLALAALSTHLVINGHLPMSVLVAYRAMKATVFGDRHDLQVVEPVVPMIHVLVMYLMARRNGDPCVMNDLAVLIDVPVLHCKRMGGVVHLYVAVGLYPREMLTIVRSLATPAPFGHAVMILRQT